MKRAFFTAVLLVGVPPLVAVFDDPRFVDTLASPPDAESDNVRASLQQLMKDYPFDPMTIVSLGPAETKE